ncbi:MAG TPA: hypothetical protein VFA38_01735, partial [Nitrospirales bacterium]|nr:hypothetical protein [Nitrospirales bacterium]
MPRRVTTEPTTPIAGTLPPGALSNKLTWGMACLTLYAMVAVGRIQEAITPLAVVHVGMIFGLLTLVAWLQAPGMLAHKIPTAVKPIK